jgi:hypothetical protein
VLKTVGIRPLSDLHKLTERGGWEALVEVDTDNADYLIYNKTEAAIRKCLLSLCYGVHCINSSMNHFNTVGFFLSNNLRLEEIPNRGLSTSDRPAIRIPARAI